MPTWQEIYTRAIHINQASFASEKRIVKKLYKANALETMVTLSDAVENARYCALAKLRSVDLEKRYWRGK